MSKDKHIINIHSLIKKKPLAALLQHLSVWACHAALLQFHYAAGKIYPEHIFSWHVIIFQCIVTISLTNSCLAGCPKLTFEYSVKSCIFCVCCVVIQKYRELLYHKVLWTHESLYTFSPAWCSPCHLSAYQANEGCGEKRTKTARLIQSINVGELSF